MLFIHVTENSGSHKNSVTVLYTYIQKLNSWKMTRYALEMQTLKRLLVFLCVASQVCFYKVCGGDSTISKYQIAN